MIYELLAQNQTVGYFLTYAEARHHASYMPKGRYVIREWVEDGELLEFDPAVNLLFEFNN